MTLEVNLLGGVSFTVGNKIVKGLPTRAAQALIIYVLHQARPVPRERLSDLLYQTSQPKQASANLRSIISSIKKELGAFILVTRKTVGVQAGAAITVDSLQFAAGTLPISDYHGDFLAGFYLRDAPEFEHWLIIEREKLRLIAIDRLQNLIGHLTESGDYQPALQHVDQLLGIEPLLENMQRMKMLLLARTGKRALALRHFASVAALFKAELGIEVSAETKALQQRLERTPLPPPHNLPALAPFVGRVADIAQLTRMLAQPANRLITLLGMGGMGKTRLSLQVARHILQTRVGMFLDGIIFVPLAAIDNADLIADHLAKNLNIPIRGGQRVDEIVLKWLREKEILLILDNFEQLVADGVPFIDQILKNAPHLKIMVTSRERLNLYEEMVFDVQGLSLPAEQSGATIDLADFDATALFMSHARRQKFDFNPSSAASTSSGQAETLAIIAICRLLEGVPLGLELAAGWVRHETPAQIEAQIRQSLDFLQTIFHNVPPRQRSLRAVFAHSWQLLTPQAQAILASLSIFPAAFDTAAALAVADASHAALIDLADKSLLQQPHADRYAIHPLLRQFSAEYLPQKAHTAAKHSAHFLRRLPQAYQAMRLSGLDNLIDDAPNFRAAWQASLSASTLPDFTPAIKPFFSYWLQRGWYAEAKQLCNAALAATQPQNPLTRPLRLQEALIFLRMGLYDLAATAFETFLAADGQATRHNDPPDPDQAAALSGLGTCHIYTGTPLTAQPLLQKSIVIYTALGDDPHLALSLGQLYLAYSHTENVHLALETLNKALALQTYPAIRAILLNYQGQVKIGEGDYRAAMHALQKCAALMQQTDNTPGFASAKVNLGIAADFADENELAEKSAHEALAIFSRNGDTGGIGVANNLLGTLQLKQAEYEQAARFFQRGRAVFKTMGSKKGEAISQTFLAQCAAGLRQPNTLDKIKEAADTLLQTGSETMLTNFLVHLAESLIVCDEPATALSLLFVAKRGNMLESHFSLLADQHIAELEGSLPPALVNRIRIAAQTLSLQASAEHIATLPTP